MDKLLTTKDASKELGVTPLRVFQLIKAGRLPAIKLGRDWIISKDDLSKVANRKNGRPRKSSQATQSTGKRNVPGSLPVSKQSGRK